MKDLFEKFENKCLEIVFEWKDVEIEVEGWVVINLFCGGVVGGGIWMWVGFDKCEVELLVKMMEVKFIVVGLFIGGVKLGINFDLVDLCKEGVF